MGYGIRVAYMYGSRGNGTKDDGTRMGGIEASVVPNGREGFRSTMGCGNKVGVIFWHQLHNIFHQIIDLGAVLFVFLKAFLEVLPFNFLEIKIQFCFTFSPCDCSTWFQQKVSIMDIILLC